MGSAALFAAIGIILAVYGLDLVMNLHGALLAAASVVALIYIFTHQSDDRSGYLDGPILVATLALQEIVKQELPLANHIKSEVKQKNVFSEKE